MDELAALDMTAQAELVKRGEILPLELVDAAIARIERLDPPVNAVIRPMFDSAREAARTVDREAPLAGVPFLLKDALAAHAGVPLTAGSRFLREMVPPFDSVLVRRYKRAGLVVLGKTNTPELGLVPVTEPALFGPCRNPWALDRTPGGSSGGSAAAVALRMVAGAHGNDGGGSIRIPAACCGLFGLKPTRGRISLGPAIGDIMGGLVVEHALTRTVRDSALLLDLTAGPAPGDPYFAAPPTRSFSEAARSPCPPLRVGFVEEGPGGEPFAAECSAALADARQLLGELGHTVEPVRWPCDGELLFRTFLTVWAAGAAATVRMLGSLIGREPNADELEPQTLLLVEAGKRVSAAQYINARGRLQTLARQLAQPMTELDALLSPTLAQLPLPLGAFSGIDDLEQGYELARRFAPLTYVANITGQPAMTLPLSWSEAGLPVGTHVTGRYGDETTLFSLAAQLEQARPWADRLPPAISS